MYIPYWSASSMSVHISGGGRARCFHSARQGCTPPIRQNFDNCLGVGLMGGCALFVFVNCYVAIEANVSIIKSRS